MSALNREIPPAQISRDELDLILELACSLDEKPGKNWVENAGGLPDYICRIARAIKRSGKSTGTAIAIAVSRAKKWCATGEADTKAKACKAVAQWEALKAKSKAKSKVKASHLLHDHLLVELAQDAQYLDQLRMAWEKAQEKSYQEFLDRQRDDLLPEVFLREVWPTHIIVASDYDNEVLFRVPFEVNNGEFQFGEMSPFAGVIDPLTQLDDMAISDTQLAYAAELSNNCCCAIGEGSKTDKLIRLAASTKAKKSGVKKPYGDVKYADPGYRDNKKRYPIDTAAHVRAAWSYINMPKNQEGYTSEEVAAIKAKIKSAANRFGIEISDD